MMWYDVTVASSKFRMLIVWMGRKVAWRVVMVVPMTLVDISPHLHDSFPIGLLFQPTTLFDSWEGCSNAGSDRRTLGLQLSASRTLQLLCQCTVSSLVPVFLPHHDTIHLYAFSWQENDHTKTLEIDVITNKIPQMNAVVTKIEGFRERLTYCLASSSLISGCSEALSPKGAEAIRMEQLKFERQR